MARPASRTTPNLQEQSLRGTEFERHRSTVVLSEDARSLRRGFTIVELLIVVVVIAILAAITIVAYSGISNRAKASAASSAAQQAAKKVLAHAVTNAEQYPSALSDAGVSNSDSTAYQYRVDNASAPKTFCLTATSQNVSYFVSSTVTSPSAGACAGHGVNGGGTITNLATNPSGEVSPAFQITGSGAGGVVTNDATRANSGSSSSKFTWGTSGSRGITTPLMQVSPSTTYRVSLAVYVESGPMPQWYVVDSTWAGVSMSPVPGLSAWHRIAATYTTGPSQTSLRVYTTTASAGAYNADSIMLVAGGSPSASYADGDTSGWIWNGTPYNSTSTGPAL